MKKKRTSRRKTVLAVVGLLAVVATVVCVRQFRTVPFDKTSAVYQRYAYHDGLKTAFFKDKHIPYADDSTGRRYSTIDMTILIADDSLTFVSLMKEWGKSDEYIEYLMSRSADSTFRMTGIRPKGYPERIADTLMANNDVVAIFPAFKTVAFFHTTTEEQAIEFTRRISFNQHIHDKTIESVFIPLSPEQNN